MQNDNQVFLDFLTVFSVVLQMAIYDETRKQTSTDELMEELQKQDREYFEKIIENQNKILNKLAKIG